MYDPFKTSCCIYVSSYHQTEFIFRNDSLYEILNSNPLPSGPFSRLFNEYYFENKIDEPTYKARLDSLHQIEIKQAVFTPKLIFAKKMFHKNKLRIKVPKKLNFMRDSIELEKQWEQNGKSCYIIRIRNKEDGEETSYAYANINLLVKYLLFFSNGSNNFYGSEVMTQKALKKREKHLFL